MTRVNVVPVTELCDQHLLAEHREITRIPNSALRLRDVVIDDYTLGTGHVLFFKRRLGYLLNRYIALHRECKRRGFNVEFNWPVNLTVALPGDYWRNYRPTANALKINRARIAARMPVNPRFTRNDHAKETT